MLTVPYIPSRQYIGARYLPIIVGDWDITKEYEPLMVVYYNGASYTSKTYIPAGIDISNTTYWALSADYNAQVAYYRSEVLALAEKVAKKIYYIDTLENLLGATDLDNNDLIFTEGYHSVADDGAAAYLISETEPTGYYETLDNGLYAKLIITAEMTLEQFGAYGDNVHDDAPAIQKAIDNAGNIICNNIYRIKSDIIMNLTGDITPEAGLKNHSIKGRGKNTSLVNSTDLNTSISENEATFVFEGGSFTLRGTSKVDFKECTFVGDTSALKQETAFKLTDPARKLNISDCTFANLKYGIYCDDNDRWSGESCYTRLYFQCCEYGFYYADAGTDCIITECIAQGNCDYMAYLGGATGLIFSNNHDYSKYGCYLLGSCVITGNYFDGLAKLHISTYTDASGSGTSKQAGRGCTITGNIFLTELHNTAVTTDTAMIIVESTQFASTVIANNTISGGLDNAKLCLVDISAASYCMNNVIENNTGSGLDAIFKGNLRSKNNYYHNKYEGFFPKVTIDNGVGGTSRISVLPIGDGAIVTIRLNNPAAVSDSIVISNFPISSDISIINWYKNNDDSIDMTFNSGYQESTRACKNQVTMFFINFGTTSITDVLFANDNVN